MFIAIIGTRFSGKSEIANYLVNHKAFIPVKLDPERRHQRTQSTSRADSYSSVRPNGYIPGLEDDESNGVLGSTNSFLSLASSIPPSPTSSNRPPRTSELEPMLFDSESQMLDYVTLHWSKNFVTTDLNNTDVLDKFIKRPWFMLIAVDAPILQRFKRSISSYEGSLEDFVRDHDTLVYGSEDVHRDEREAHALHNMKKLATIHIVNEFDSIVALHSYLDDIDLLNGDRLRPSWDTYFMKLASLASMRSNCMKRRVGAILVRNHRIVATGYNGTPRGLTNCNEGGCARCNGLTSLKEDCLCLHAEENALLEAGRDRIGDGAVLYCNTCPCLTCTIKIVQSGVKEVVYNLSYKVDDASAQIFQNAGIALRRHAPPPDTV